MSSALRLSIFVNIILVGAVTVLVMRERPAASTAAVPPAPPAGVAPSVPATTAGSGETPADAAPPKLGPSTVAQLERMGISRDVFVSALREDFQRRWDRRFVDLEKRYAPRPVPEREYIELGRMRDAEQIRELKEVLGEAGYREWDKAQTLRFLNGTGMPMTPEEAEQAYRLQKEFEQTHRELQMAMEDGVADRADGSTLQAQAQEALERELEKLFGKERLNEMRGLADPVADVRWRYGDLNPTPEQANAVLLAEGDFRAREAALAKRLGDDPAAAANVATELKALEDAREENLRRIFGAEAYNAMKRENDPAYQTLRQYAEAWQLDQGQVDSVYATLHAFHDEASRTRVAAAMREAAGQPVNWREINAAIAQAQQQTEAGLQNLIGGERVRRLKQNGLLTNVIVR